MSERTERCETCKFWDCWEASVYEITGDANETNETGGLCRVGPPTHRNDNGVGQWDLVSSDEWCGGWKPKTPPPPEPLAIATELPEFEATWEEWTKAKPFTIGSRVLSVRATKCLARAGIFTVDELLRYPDDVLLKIRNFGYTTLLEVEEALQEIGKELPISP